MKKKGLSCIGRCLVIGGILMLGMAICASFAPTVSAAEAKVAVKEWEIPMLSVLTGPLAFAGGAAGWGADYAAKMINQAGGIAGMPVKITKYDTAYDNAKAVALIAQVAPTSLVILGPINSGGSMAVASFVQEAGIPVISGAFTSQARSSQRPWGLSDMQDMADVDVTIVKWLSLHKDIKSIIIFYLSTNPASSYEAGLAEAMLSKIGIKVVAKIDVGVGQVEMRPQAAKALSLKADGYYTNLTPDEYVKLVKALKGLGMKDGWRIMSHFSANAPALFNAGKGFLEDTYISDCINLNHSSAEWKAFRKAYQADHNGADPLTPTVGFYDAVYAIKAAIESEGITGDPAKRVAERQKIRDFLYNNSHLQGAMGPYRYVNGNKVAPFVLLQIKNNKLVTVAEVPGPATPAP